MDRPDQASDTLKASLAGIALINIATLSWATNMALARWLRNDIGPLALAAARFSIAAVLFALLLVRRSPEERRPGRDLKLLAAMGLVGVVVFAPTLYLGLRYTTTTNATLINGFGPLITGVLAAVIIREPMSKRQVAGALVALVGVVALISGGAPAFLGEARFNPGDVIMVVAVALWGLYSVLGRQAMRERSAISATAFSTFLGLPLLLLAAILELRAIPVNLSSPHPSSSSWAARKSIFLMNRRCASSFSSRDPRTSRSHFSWKKYSESLNRKTGS